MKNAEFLKNNGVNLEASLELLGDIEMYDETLNDFINEFDSKISQLKTYKENGDMLNYAIVVHSLKSDAKYLGFTKLAELSFNHEMSSKANDINFVNANFESLMQEANQVMNIAKAYSNGGTVSPIPVQNTLQTAIPQSQQPVTTQSPVEPQRSLSTDKKILIVDDSNIIRNLVQKVFDTEYNVLMASDGQEAINIVSSNTGNLVGMLLDLNMPNVNGFQVLDFFASNNLFDKIPVVIITGDDSKESVFKAFDYPIVDVLNKPFNEDSIKRVVSRMINLK